MLKKSPYISGKKYFVYAILFQGEENHGYIKIGRTCRVDQRLYSLRASCPLPAKYYAVIEAGTLQNSIDLEKMLKFRFSNRKATGEWFKFNFKSKKDKAEFNSGCGQVFASFFKNDRRAWWTKINAENLEALRSEERNTRTSVKTKTVLRRNAEIKMLFQKQRYYK